MNTVLRDVDEALRSITRKQLGVFDTRPLERRLSQGWAILTFDIGLMRHDLLARSDWHWDTNCHAG